MGNMNQNLSGTMKVVLKSTNVDPIKRPVMIYFNLEYSAQTVIIICLNLVTQQKLTNFRSALIAVFGRSHIADL